MSKDAEFKIVFMIGSGRSGSSLVHELISQHRDVGFVSNFDDNFPFLNSKGSLNSRLFRSPLGKITKKGGFRFAPSEAYRLISKTVSPIYADSSRNLRASDVTPELRRSFRKFFYDRCRAQGKEVFVHKYTGWSRVGFFKEIFPEAKFIHIVRDGRAVANSFIQMDWWTGFKGPDNWYLGPLCERHQTLWDSSDRSFLVLAGIAWEILVTSVEQDVNPSGQGSVCTVRYEDFLADPISSIRDLCEFSELDFDSDMESRILQKGIDSSRKQAFLTDLSTAQVAELTSCISGTLAKFGYTGSAETVSSDS
jgi:hypothetical protein